MIVTKTGRVKICDVGLALPDGHERCSDYGGTIPYMAPEIVKGYCDDWDILARLGGDRKAKALWDGLPALKSRGKGVDIWALGCVIYELLMGKHPYLNYENKGDMEDFADIIKWASRIPLLSIDIPRASPQLKAYALEFFNKVFEPNPRRRWTINDIKKSIFYKFLVDERRHIATLGNEKPNIVELRQKTWKEILTI